MSDDVVRVERRIAAPPPDVFRYLTESAAWARWQGETAEIDPRPGGRFRMTLSQGPVVEGEFVEVVQDARVVFTWGWVGSPTVPPGSSMVEIELSVDGDGTLVRLTHRGLPREEQPIHHAGWDYYLPRLASAATGGDPGPDLGPG